MSPDGAREHPSPPERIELLVNEFFDRRERGELITPEGFLREHSSAAEELRPYLEGLTLVERARAVSIEDSTCEPRGRDTALPAIPGYEVVAEIGRGGMGVVYQAVQDHTHRPVALKVMLGGAFASTAARRRFEREVELAARLHHPGIVGVLESSEVAGQQYYAMEYVEGIRLDDFSASNDLGAREKIALFVGVCDAVAYAHEHGVIHRDLKPANVLVDSERTPHVLDFGLAKAIDQAEQDAGMSSLSRPGQVLGTLNYLSPEQAAGNPDAIDERTDVYALGVMLFELLTGSLPYDVSGRPSDVLNRIQEASITYSPMARAKLAAELRTILRKALEKDKSRRYASVEALAEDLRRFLSGEPILARGPSAVYILRKKLIKHWGWAACGAFVVVFALFVWGYGAWAERREHTRARVTALSLMEGLEGGSGGVNVSTGSAKVALEKHPELIENRLVWAQSLYRNPEARDSAVRYLEGELRKDPSQWAYRALLADMHARMDPQRAAELRASAERDMPDSAEGWYIRSFTTFDLHEARTFAEQAIAHDPAHRLALERVTVLRLKTGDTSGALAGAQRLVELGVDEAGWELFIGHVYAAQAEYERAAAQYSKVIARRPDWAQGYRYRAHVRRRLQQYGDAVGDYDEALARESHTSTNVWDYYQRATPLWILGRTDEALEDYARVRVMLARPSYADARQYLILRDLGREAEADELLQAALVNVEDDWLRSVFRTLVVELPPADLVAIAESRGNREHICEARYYAGEVSRLAGDLEAARRWFAASVETGVQYDLDTFPVTPMNEHELAQWRLATLTPDNHPSSNPTNNP